MKAADYSQFNTNACLSILEASHLVVGALTDEKGKGIEELISRRAAGDLRDLTHDLLIIKDRSMGYVGAAQLYKTCQKVINDLEKVLPDLAQL